MVRRFLSPVCLTGLFLLGSAPAVCVADALEEIVVVARRQSESLLTVPLAVDVLDSQSFGPGGVDSLYTLSGRLPGLIHDSRQGGAQTATSLRGQQQSTTFNNDTVGIFVDGVFQANKDNVDVDLLDMARVEVVRGPQSTLFGHSTFAGAIHYVSAMPSESTSAGFRLDGGTHDLLGMEAWLSGPLPGPVLGRIAVGLRSFDGTHDNSAPHGGTLGDLERQSLAATLVTDASVSWVASLKLRLTRQQVGTSAYNIVDFEDFNCGARTAAVGPWSYFCGDLPVNPEFDLSAHLDETEGRASQAVLNLEIPFERWAMTSQTSWYDAASDAIRDSSGGGTGVLFGVCVQGETCSGGSTASINRNERRNIVDSFDTSVREVSQEFRVAGSIGESTAWLLGIFGWRNTLRFVASTGVARGSLQKDEQLTGHLPTTPNLVGPVSILNRALVDDPFEQHLPRNGFKEQRESWGLFGTLTQALSQHIHLRVEARASRERLRLDSLYDNFRTGFGDALPAGTFDSIAPRFSLDWQPNTVVSVYLSRAKGSRSGGINALTGLVGGEQRYDEETNWTTELGARYAGDGWLRRADLTLFHIDWRDTQIPSFSNTPGVAGLIVTNTAGVETRGLESSVTIEPLTGLRIDASWAWISPAFDSGSDSPGDSSSCGLTARNAVSSFCVVGPARGTGFSATPVVPYIDDGPLPRIATRPWHVGVELNPQLVLSGWQFHLRADVDHRNKMYDRPIKGMQFGERTLLDVSIGARRRGWSVDLWSKNVTDEKYIRTTAPGFPQYFSSTPRPVYLFYGERRRIGLTLRRDLES